MAQRLLVGLLIGLLVGAIFAFAIAKGLSMVVFGGAVLAYLFAALTGAVTGLVAGKPIWARGGQIEAGLKAVFGALLAAFAMFALRKWGDGIPVPNLSAIGMGGGQGTHFGDVPGVALPLIAAVLGAFYGLDNTVAGEAEKDASKKTDKKLGAAKSDGGKAAPAKTKARVESSSANGEEEEPAIASKRAKR